ncbi:DUF4905 domain-containing protein [Roseivirga echinicomitans]
MPKQLHIQFSEVFLTDIWETALSNDQLLISCRNGDEMEATFSLFDLNSHKFGWKALGFDENWWVTVYAFVDNIIVFQIFNDTQNIDERSVFGFDIHTQEALWSVDNINVRGIRGYLLSLKPSAEEGELFSIDIRDGSEVLGTEQDFSTKNMSGKLILPFHYTGDSPYFSTVVNFMKQFANVDLVGACDYLEYEGLIFISAHEKVEQNLTNTLYAFNEAGELMLTEVLAQQSKGLASDTFYIVNEQLIFVQEKREIKCYLIKNV